MKKLLSILSLFLLAFSSLSVMPSGWYSQSLPVFDSMNDIYFVDTLNGWIVTKGRFNTDDTAYIMHTTNGGDNWVVQKNRKENLNRVQFIDVNTGYAAGGVNGTTTLSLYKTTNGGDNWIPITNVGGIEITDIHFINADTGWICDDAPPSFGAGLLKTTNGGGSWTQQLNSSFQPLKLCFINKDTGWVGTFTDKLYRTTNGGANWILQYTTNTMITSLFFINGNNGWIRGGTTNGVLYTTNGGFNWNNAQGENAPFNVKFVNDSIGFAGGGNQPLRIAKSTDGGRNWGYQTAQAAPYISVAILKGDTRNVWAGRDLLIHTSDGGGPVIMTSIEQISSHIPEHYKLYQNYPNPFNPVTTIEFELQKTSDIRLEVFNSAGKLVGGVGYSQKAPGKYRYEFKADNLTSGIYFYRLLTNGSTVDTKKMVLIK